MPAKYENTKQVKNNYIVGETTCYSKDFLKLNQILQLQHETVDYCTS